MIGVDTNVVLRLFTDDQPHQTAAVLRLIAGQGRGSIRIDNIVLAELIWVLSRAYKTDRRAVAAAVASLLRREELVFESRGAILTALRWYQDGRADFADYLIAASNMEAAAAPTHTFDLRAAEHSAFSLLPP